MRASLLLLALLVAWSPCGADEQQLPPLEAVRLLREARIAETTGDAPLALRKLTTTIESYPDEITALIALIDHHRRYAAPAQEVARLRGFLTQRLADRDTPIFPGTLEYLVFNPDAQTEELELLRHAVESRMAGAPPTYAMLDTLSVLQERLGQFDDARATFVAMLEIENRPTTHMRCLKFDEANERWDEAAGHLKALMTDEMATAFRMPYIAALGKVGQYDEIAIQLEILASEVDTSKRAFAGPLMNLLVEVGWSFRELGQPEKAEALFRRVLEIDPRNRDARRTILYLYSGKEERLAHEADLEQRLSAETDANTLLNEGATKLSAGDAAGAILLLERAALALPDSESAHFNLGLAASRLERWEDAERALGRAIELNPARGESYLSRGIALQSLGRWEQAVAVLHQALEAQPALTQSHYYLYLCYSELRDLPNTAKHRDLYTQSTAGND